MTANRIGWMALGTAALGLVACTGSDDTGVVIPNGIPVAEAGSDQAGPADSIVELDGRASFDPDGDTLAFHWDFDHVPEGSTLGGTERAAGFSRNGSADAGQTTFIPDVQGTYVVSLVVNDGKDDSPPDFVVVTAEAPAGQPVAVAGADLAGAVSETITLDGSGSYDPFGRDLTYTWTLVESPSGSSAALQDATSAAGWFIADARGVYVVNLVVNNGLTSSDADAVLVTITGEDNVPTANAGEDMAAEDCTAIQLDGSASADPDGDPLQYFWEVQAKPKNSTSSNDSFSDRTASQPTFWADVAGTYQLSLSVYDGAGWSTPDPLLVEVGERSYNTDPAVVIDTLDLVDAGEANCEEDGYVYDCEECENQTLTLGENVTITDADGDPYTTLWELTEGEATIADETSVVTSVKLEEITPTEPSVCDTLEYEFRLTVTDCTGGVTKASTTISAQCCGVEEGGTGTTSTGSGS